MSKVGILCADGLEEVECLTVVDYLRRANIDIEMISITGRRQIMGAHQIHFIADTVFEDVDFKLLDGIILPGGGVGTKALGADPDVGDIVKEFYYSGRLTAAICAAPGVLAMQGILKDKKATMYPGMEPEDCGVKWTGASVVRDGNIITGKGPAKAGLFALELIRYLEGEETMRQVESSVIMN